jgi:hypothetical protein
VTGDRVMTGAGGCEPQAATTSATRNGSPAASPAGSPSHSSTCSFARLS